MHFALPWFVEWCSRVKGEGQWQEEMGCAGCKRLFHSRHRTRSKWHLAFQGASPWGAVLGQMCLLSMLEDIQPIHWQLHTSKSKNEIDASKHTRFHVCVCVGVLQLCLGREGMVMLCYVMLIFNQKLFIQDEYINFLSPLTINIARSLSS